MFTITQTYTVTHTTKHAYTHEHALLHTSTRTHLNIENVETAFFSKEILVIRLFNVIALISFNQHL